VTTIRTQLGNTIESARRERFEPTGNVSATNVQDAIQQVDAEAAGKVQQVGTIRLAGDAAAVNILPTDIEVGIDTRTQAVNANLPSVAAWSADNPNGLDLVLVDFYGNAAAHNITPVLSAGDAFQYGGVTPLIVTNFGSLRLRPSPGLNAWYVRGIG
jgi:hypothetical protein